MGWPNTSINFCISQFLLNNLFDSCCHLSWKHSQFSLHNQAFYLLCTFVIHIHMCVRVCVSMHVRVVSLTCAFFSPQSSTFTWVTAKTESVAPKLLFLWMLHLSMQKQKKCFIFGVSGNMRRKSCQPLTSLFSSALIFFLPQSSSRIPRSHQVNTFFTH